MKELTNAVRKQQRALEARLEACLEELRRLCLREAVRLLESLPPHELSIHLRSPETMPRGKPF